MLQLDISFYTPDEAMLALRTVRSGQASILITFKFGSLLFFFPPQAYTMPNSSVTLPARRRLQGAATGVQSNPEEAHKRTEYLQDPGKVHSNQEAAEPTPTIFSEHGNPVQGVKVENMMTAAMALEKKLAKMGLFDMEKGTAQQKDGDMKVRG
jgi:hypothetical protein